MRKLGLLLGCLLLLGTFSANAANIHLRYFESVDAFLTEERFQRYSFAGLADEEITIVAYGLDENVIPTLTVFDTIGSTLIENPNEDELSAVAVRFTVTENGIYTFLVSRQTDEGGLIRVMVFEGDPLTDDRSLLDEVDPLLPARAFLFAGDEVDPVEIQISVVDDDDPETSQVKVYASRGTDVELPPLEERTEPVTTRIWENTDSERIYTVNIRALPEPVAHVNGFFSRKQQEDLPDSGILQIDVNEGGEPEPVKRPLCIAFVLETVQSFGGPSAEDYPPATLLNRGEEVEIVGQNGEFLLIVDPNSDTGGSWIPSVSVDIPSGLDSEDCSRVQEVAAPPIEPSDVEPDDTSDTGFTPPTNTTNPPQATNTPVPQTAGNPSENWCYDPAKWGDGRCNSGSPEQNDWHWTCGFYLAAYDRDRTIGNVPAECQIVIPPSPTPQPPSTGTFPGAWSGCVLMTGWNVAVTYSGTPPGTSFVILSTNYGSATGPVTGSLVYDTLQPSVPPIVVTGTLTAYDASSTPLASVSLGSINCP